jgi:hypothetical protein
MFIKDYNNSWWDNYYDTHYTTYSYWTPTPTQKDFTLDVISHHPEFEGKTLRKYNLDGIDTIGAYGDERFTVRFSNNSNEDVQVRLSLDGTDIYTGKLANLDVNHDMFVVRAHKTLNLKAWRETNNGGAAFVFTSEDKSVSLHTHGDVSHKGIIAAAVYVEQDRTKTYTSSVRRAVYPKSYYTLTSNSIGGSMASGGASAIMGSSISDRSESFSENVMDGLIPASASVGAGEYTEQKLTTVQGLNKPVLNTVVRLRYMWFDNLVEKLKTQRPQDIHQSGFPGAKSFADLSNVPRVQSVGSQQPQTTNMFDSTVVRDPRFNISRTV